MAKQDTSDLCAVRDCKNPVRARGLCTTHYQQQRRRKTLKPPKGPMLPMAQTTGVFARISKRQGRVLAKEARRLGFRSRYRLAAQILEDWVPPVGEYPPTGV